MLPDAPRSVSEDDWAHTIAKQAHDAVLRMRPHEKLIVERHEAEMGKPLFTLTFQSPTGGAYG